MSIAALEGVEQHGTPRRSRRAGAVRALLVASGLLLASAPAHADIADDVAACEIADFQRCPALQKAAASRKTDLALLVARLTDAATPAQAKARLAMGLAMLDARDHKDALETAAQQLANAPELADIRAAQARLGDARAVADLVKMLSPQRELRQRLLAAGSLGVLRAKEAAEPLIAALGDAKVPRMQAEAARALTGLADARAEEPLANLAGHPGAFVPARAEALRALGALNSPKARSLALLMAGHPSADLGRAALEVLRAHWAPWAEPAVLASLDLPGHRGAAARIAADRQLSGLGAKLVALVSQGDLSGEELVFVLDAVGKLRPSGASKALLQRLKGAAPLEEKLELLKTFPKVGDLTILAELVPLLGDSDNRIVSNTVYALENLSGQRLGPDVKAWRQYTGLDPALKTAPVRAPLPSATAPKPIP